MSMTADEARDQILQVFKDAWDPTGFVATYTDVAGEVPPSQSVWARAIVRHATGGQSTLSGPINGCVRQTYGGTVYVQVFAPVGDGSTSAYDAAQIVLNAYKASHAKNVWFRDVRINEVGTRGAFEQINVLAEFTYDDTR